MIIFVKATIFLGIVASFLETLFLALLDKPASASISGAAFVILFVFQYFPDLESFKALGVEAKLRKKLSEADDILKKMKQVSRNSAENYYHQLAWINRWGTAKIQKKMAYIQRTDSTLKEVGLSDEDIFEAKKPFLASLLSDLHQSYQGIILARRNEIISELTNQRNSIFGKNPINMSSPDYSKYEELNVAIRKMGSGEIKSIMDSENPLEDFLDEVRKCAKKFNLPESDEAILSEHRLKVEKIANNIWKSGNYTPDSLEFIGDNSQTTPDKYYREIFKNNTV